MLENNFWRYAVFGAFLTTLSFSCKSPTGPRTSYNVQLSAQDVGCTEVWLKIGFADSPNGGDFAINRVPQTGSSNGTTVISGHFSGKDTTVVDDNVQANKTYNYIAYRMVNGRPSEQSQTLQVRTMDTTSNNWTFQTFTFGGSQSSVLNDVAIINDTLAYAVGEVYGYDSTGQVDQQPYGIAKWDGRSWSLIRLLDNAGYPLTPIRGIFVVSPNDIWLAAGSVYHWDGISSQAQLSFSRLTLSDPNATIEKLWGTSSSSLYGIGNAGTIIWYNGTVWQKLTSGTTTGINDVWGVGNSPVYCAVSNPFDPNEDKRILRITGGNKVDTIKWIGRHVNSVWTPDGTHLYACGDGVFENDGSGWKKMVTGASIGTSSIRGNANNDIVVVGGYGFIAHWNGASFRIYPPAMDVIYTSVAITGNLIVAVGTTGAKAVVTIGRR
ncbi:MAG: hypothetical protein M1470_02645 [Bacteroidetes bacterium]|nr:hypothetical protein [Bacteroidota bacterium]MCL5738930.1 hypothetical protein [Bacteroidota bacterium]